MSNQSQIIWHKCLVHIKQKIPAQSYQTWFAPIIPHKYESNTLTIRVPNQFFCEWLEGHYINLLQQVIRQEIGPNGRLSYQITQKSPKKTTKSIKKANATTNFSSTLWGKLHLNPNFTFENLVIGDCNELVQAAAQVVANNPGKTSFNLLFIHSPIGLGKTHIAQATANHIQNHHPDKKIAYLTTQKFTALFIQKIRENKVQEFVEAFSNLDVIIMDDIQFLNGKEKTQEIFFHIFNHLQQHNKQIIIASDTPPNDLQGFEKRLLSRFKWGLTADLQKPDLETRIAIIQKKLSQKKFHLSQPIIHYIATNVTSNIREIEGVLVSLIAYADLKKTSIDKKLVQHIIQNLVEAPTTEPELNIQYLKKTVANYYKISIEELQGKSRERRIVIPRKLVMYLARKYTTFSLQAIGQALGKKDHSTVSYAITSIRQRITADQLLANQVNEINKIIRQSKAAIN